MVAVLAPVFGRYLLAVSPAERGLLWHFFRAEAGFHFLNGVWMSLKIRRQHSSMLLSSSMAWKQLDTQVIRNFSFTATIYPFFRLQILSEAVPLVTIQELLYGNTVNLRRKSPS